jgi:hypothetical protein
MTAEQAEQALRGKGLHEAADHVKGYRNKSGGKAGWDASLGNAFPEESRLLWPGGYHNPMGGSLTIP